MTDKYAKQFSTSLAVREADHNQIPLYLLK